MRMRYTAWDGTQTVRLRAEEIFDELYRRLSHTGDLQEALERFLREGMAGEHFEVRGLDDLVREIQSAIDELRKTYHFDDALRDRQRRLDDLVARESAAVGQMPEGAERTTRTRFLHDLPLQIDEALRRLRDYRFVRPGSASEFDDLAEEAPDIDRLAEFIRHQGHLFQGAHGLDFDEALDLLDRLELLRRLEALLVTRELDDLSFEEIEAFMGPAFAASLRNLRSAMAMLSEAGFFTVKDGRMELSPRGARRFGQLALREVYAGLARDGIGQHGTATRGVFEVCEEGRRPYSYGEPMQLDALATVRNAIRRRPTLPANVEPSDFEVFESTHSTRNATVLLLDMSWSMSWEGRFLAAKKVALALQDLVRARFPSDYFAVVGFYTRAVELKRNELPSVTWNMGDPFTNLQDGLRLGARLLARQACRNKHMIVITDGQPTAYYARDGRLYCEWPMSLGSLSTRATVETLGEVERVTRQGIVINTFMLDDSPPLRAFVQKMTSINKGRAFYTSPDKLGHYLLVDYVGRRRKVV